MARERLISAQEQPGDLPPTVNHALRPTTFDQYVGQEKVVERLKIAVSAARTRKEPVEHVLLHGPPGLGKTTLAHVIANEMAAQVFVSNGPALTKGADLVGVLTKLKEGDILFIDEIHRLPSVVEEYLYPAMEDFKVDITLDSGMHARTITMPLPRFTLIGATTRMGLLTAPMRGRFSLPLNLSFYDVASLSQILQANARLLGIKLADSAVAVLASRSRGTPRVSNRLLRRVRDYALVKHNNSSARIDADVCDAALALEGIDKLGLDEQDRGYLRVLMDVYSGGPAGVEALAATLGEELDTLTDVVEPYLLQSQLIVRTRQGRRATKSAYDHLGLTMPARVDAPDLYTEEL